MVNRTPASGFNKSSWGERHTVVLLCFLMGALNYSLRLNLSIAIVAMVSGPTADIAISPPTTPSTSDLESDRRSPPSHHLAEMCPSLRSKPKNLTQSQLSAESQLAANSVPGSPTFNWDERDQGLILGSFYWGYLITQIPSGLLAQKYGAKWIIAGTMFATAILSIGLPHAAIIGGRDWLIVIRILQGLAEGFFVPALISLQSKWIPDGERARLSAICCSGYSFGIGVTMLTSGHIIGGYGWQMIFYLPGGLTILLVLMWIWKVHSSPDQHPKINGDELTYIKMSILSVPASDPDHEENIVVGGGGGEGEINLWDVPWKEILTSLPVLAVFISHFANEWALNMIQTEGPKYLHSALHFNIHDNGYLAAAPCFIQILFSPAIGKLSDMLLERRLISMLTARKLCNTVGQWGVCLTFAGVILSGCNRLPAVICFILSGIVNGAMLSGVYVNIIDLTPNHAGVIEGVINCVSNAAGFGIPYLAGLILYHEPSILGWCYVFAIPLTINLIGNLVFLIGADVRVQIWNFKRPEIGQPNSGTTSDI